MNTNYGNYSHSFNENGYPLNTNFQNSISEDSLSLVELENLDFSNLLSVIKDLRLAFGFNLDSEKVHSSMDAREKYMCYRDRAWYNKQFDCYLIQDSEEHQKFTPTEKVSFQLENGKIKMDSFWIENNKIESANLPKWAINKIDDLCKAINDPNKMEYNY